MRALGHPRCSFAMTSVRYASGSVPDRWHVLMIVRATAMSAAPFSLPAKR